MRLPPDPRVSLYLDYYQGLRALTILAEESMPRLGILTVLRRVRCITLLNYSNSREVITRATVSFTKDFAITNKETVERLEKGILTTKPLVIDSKKVLTEKKGIEERLLDLPSGFEV